MGVARLRFAPPAPLAAPIVVRSFMSVVIETRQPSPTSPIRSASAMRASVKYTSLNSASPVIWRRGRTSTPGACMSTMKYVRPLCFGSSGSVRATSMPRSARWASVFQTFWPLTTHSSPSRTARVARPARSEPAPGSEKSWHQISSPVNIGRSARRRRSSRPCVATVGPASESPKKSVPLGAFAPASRSLRSTCRCTIGGRFRPPKPSGKCTHARPRSYWAPRSTTGSVCFGSCSASRSSSRASTRVRSLSAIRRA